MHCSDNVDLIALMLEGSLPQEDVRALEEHLSLCGRCRAELGLQRKIRAALAGELRPTLSPDFTQRVSEKALEIARAERKESTWTAYWSTVIPVAGPAIAAAVIFAFWPHVSRALASPAELLVGALADSVSAVGHAFLRAGTDAGTVVGDAVSGLGKVPQPLGSLLVTGMLAVVSVMWGFHRVLGYVRK